MKLGIIIETKEAEKAWNAFRFAVTAQKSGHATRVFLMGEAVEIENNVHEKFNAAEQLKNYLSAGGEISACGSCLKTRNLPGSAACPISTMNDCLKIVEWADKVITF